VARVIDVVRRHASVRAYAGPVEERDLADILEAARRAPTAWNLQPFYVSVVRDGEAKARVAEAVGGQRHVAEAPVFLAFNVDLEKILEAARLAGVEPANPGLGGMVQALVDVGIASGWAALAAEDLGYGVAFIALYGNPCGVQDALGLPRQLVPVVGLAIGKPAETPEPRPRQPPGSLYGEGPIPPARERARGVLEVYGVKARRLFNVVLAPGGYMEKVGSAFRECWEKAGYRV